MPNTALPDHLKGKLHWDFPKWLQWVPRSWTSFLCVQPPILLLGNQKNYSLFGVFLGNSYCDTGVNTNRHWNGRMYGPDPIPNPLLSISKGNPWGFCWGLYGVQLGKWLPVLPVGIAFSFKLGIRRIHARLGFRWDVADSYYTFPTIEISGKKKYD